MSENEKMQTRITPNTDTFHAVYNMDLNLIECAEFSVSSRLLEWL